MSCMFVRYHFGLTIVYVFALNHGTIIPISLHFKNVKFVHLIFAQYYLGFRRVYKIENNLLKITHRPYIIFFLFVIYFVGPRPMYLYCILIY